MKATLALIVSLLGLSIAIFRPVPKATELNVYERIVTIESVFEGPSKDIVFKISGEDLFPYINRGVELGFSVQKLNSQLKGKEVNIKLINHWTPLDWHQKHPSLAQIELKAQGITLYDAISSR